MPSEASDSKDEHFVLERRKQLTESTAQSTELRMEKAVPDVSQEKGKKTADEEIITVTSSGDPAPAHAKHVSSS